MQVKIYFYLDWGTWHSNSYILSADSFLRCKDYFYQFFFRFSLSHVDANNIIRIELIQ